MTESNISEKTLERYTQEAVAYTPVSITSGVACANCRWFIGTLMGGPVCHIIQNYPLDVEPTGYCNKHESVESAMLENTLTPTPIPVEIVGIQEMAHREPENEPSESVYIAPKPETIVQKLVGKLSRKSGLKSGTSVFKGADGKRYMLVVTSNSYQDRDQETITTQALQADTDRAWKADDVFQSDNPLLFWHDDRLVIGQIVYADVKTPFLVELAQEANNPIAKAAFDYREANPNEEWGASHRFAYFKKDRSDDGTFRQIRKQETTILPREAAANLLTFSGVIPMPTKRDEYLNKMLGLPNASELLDKGIGELVAAMQARGLEHKSVDAPPAQAATAAVQEAEKEFGSLMLALMDSQADLMERQDTLESGAQSTVKSAVDKTADLEAQVKALKEQVEVMQIQLDQRPRSASRSGETELENKNLSQNMQDSLTHVDPMWGRVKDTV